MSLQEIERSNVVSGVAGLQKGIHGASEKMVLDILQVTQYSKPIESTVRELASNAVDSQREKEIAIEILTGKAKPEDYFIEREGAQYEDSKWDPSYFDLNWLNKDVSTCTLKYIEGEGTGFTDKFIVRDDGVGLGMPRLKGYFSLGYSTKRNTQHSLGAFGLGAKASLSTGTPFYTLETAHNGKKFIFNCYAYKVDSLVPKFNLETGEENPCINIGTKDEPFYAHYLKTDSKNYTEIITGVKRHNRQKYIQSVKHQLLYFKNVKFEYVNEDGGKRDIDFHAEVLYNSNYLLVSNTSQYNRPHIIIVKEPGSSFGVSYGSIDFQELEMQQFFGSCGFKCPTRSVKEDPVTGEKVVISEGISVTPSRESVIWDEHTKEFIEKIISKARDEAENIIASEISGATGPFDWIEKVNSIMSRMHYSNYSGTNGALSVLSNLVDKSSLRPTYKLENGNLLRYTSSLVDTLPSLQIRKVYLSYEYDKSAGKQVAKVKRDDVESWSMFFSMPKYIVSDEYVHTQTKDKFIINNILNGEPFISVRILPEDKAFERIKGSVKNPYSESFTKRFKKSIESQDILLSTMVTELSAVNYDEVEVTQEFEEELKVEESPTRLTPKELRALKGQIPLNTFKLKYDSMGSYELRLELHEPKLEDIKAMERKVVYGVQEHDELLKALCYFNMHKLKVKYDFVTSRLDYFDFTDHQKSWPEEVPMVVRVSKRNLKHVKNEENFIFIEDYIRIMKSDTYRLGTDFIPYVNANLFRKKLKAYRFLENYAEVHPQLAALYKKLNSEINQADQYTGDHYFNRSTVVLDMIQRATAFAEVQLMELSNPSEDDLGLSERIGNFVGETYKDIKIIDVLNLEWAKAYLEIREYAKDIYPLFNNISILTDQSQIGGLTDQVLNHLQVILEFEGLKDYELSEDSKTFITPKTQETT